MTPEQLISLVRDRIGGRRFHEEVIRFSIGRAYSMFMSEQKDLTPYRVDYHNIDVSKENGKYYSLLPNTLLNIPDAIRITQTGGSSMVFEEMADGQSEVFEELEVSIISDIVGFKLRSDRVLYSGIGQNIQLVDMAIVIPFEKYDFTDEIYLPVGSDELIIQTSTEFLINKPLSVDINDGVN